MTRKTYPDLKEGIEIAKLLETSAEYLVTGTEPGDLNENERKLMGAYRKLCKSDQENVILAVNAWLGKGRS